MAETTAATPSSAAGGEEEDFFSSWDKPAAKPTASSASSPAVPIIGRAATVTGSPAPRTISSSSLRSTSTTPGSRPGSKLGAARLTSSPAVSTTSTAGAAAPKKSKLGGLGARKAAAPIDFAEAERKAVEDAERIRQLGYDREKERQEEEERTRKAAEAKAAAASTSSRTLTPSSNGKTTAPAEVKPLGSAQDMERLGMGMKRLGFGAVPAAAAAPKASVADDAPTTARDKFGSQKAISSDMYFGRGTYDPVAQGEAQTRLQNFQGASSISSNQYFGREEDEMQGVPGGGDGMLADGTLSNLEVAAKEAISRVMANPDVQNAAETIRAGALRVRTCLDIGIIRSLTHARCSYPTTLPKCPSGDQG